MARERSKQPESPLLGNAVQLDGEETLEGDPGTDPLDSGYVPPDRPVAVNDYSTTLAGERAGEPLDDRLARDEPDVTEAPEEASESVTSTHRVGGVSTADAEEASESDEVVDEVPAARSGRLVRPDEGVRSDTEPTMIGGDVGIDGGAASAEEAAVHECDEDEGAP